MLIRLRGCPGWSAPLLFAYGKNRFSHDGAHIKFNINCWFYKASFDSKMNLTKNKSNLYCTCTCTGQSPFITVSDITWSCHGTQLVIFFCSFCVKLSLYTCSMVHLKQLRAISVYPIHSAIIKVLPCTYSWVNCLQSKVFNLMCSLFIKQNTILVQIWSQYVHKAKEKKLCFLFLLL